MAPVGRLETARLVMRRWTEADREQFEAYGYGLWALERRDGGAFLGFTGPAPVRGDLPCAPALEVGWRLARVWWGHGYATEAAREAALTVVFARIGTFAAKGRGVDARKTAGGGAAARLSTPVASLA